MYLKRLLVVVFSLVLLITVAPTLAGGGPFVYLYNANSHDLVRVGVGSDQTAYNLNLDKDSYISGFGMAFSPDGSRVAYCITKFDQNTSVSTATLYVRDVVNQTTIAQKDLGTAIACQTGQSGFSADGTQLVLSRVNHYAGDPAANADQPVWELHVLDSQTLQTLYEIDSALPAAIQAGINTDHFSVMPFVQYFDHNQIVFVALPYGGDGPTAAAAYLWQLDSGTISPINNWGSLSAVSLSATGELVWPDYNDQLPHGEVGGPMPPNNVVLLADKSGQAHPIFYSPDWLPIKVAFIDNGRRLGIELVSPFDPNNAIQPQTTKWVALDRTGAITDLVNNNYVLNSDVRGIVSGNVAFTTQYADATYTNPTYRLSFTVGGRSTEVWSKQETDPAVTWELAWATPMSIDPNLPAFPTINP